MSNKHNEISSNGQSTQHLGFHTLCIFGDSLQDNGNLRQTVGFPLEPFSGGRFCEGPVASEYLRDYIYQYTNIYPQILNYAVGGALTSGKNPKTVIKHAAFPLHDQLDRFCNKHNYFRGDELVILNGGGNNFLFAVHDEKPFINIAGVYRVAEDIKEVADRLLKKGAGYLVIWNVPDATYVPAFNASPFPEWFSKIYKKYLKHNIHKQNRKIANYVQSLQLKYPERQIELFDAHHLFYNAIQNPFTFGFENAMHPCVKSFGGVDEKGQVQKDLAVLADPEKYMFWDYVHPTSKGQRMIANGLFDLLKTRFKN